MKKLILISALLFSFNGWADGLDLACTGVTQVPKNSIASSSATAFGGGNTASGTGTTIVTQFNDAEATIILHFDDGFTSGWIDTPSHMRPPIGGNKVEKFELKDVSASETEIKANFRINWLNKPKITINRVTGTMSYRANAWPKNFSGSCEQIDVSKKKF